MGESIERLEVLVAPYEPHPNDPVELQNDCPICPAKAGFWCGGFGDIHEERKQESVV